MLALHVTYRQVEHAWLDLGLLDKTPLGQMSTDLSNANTTVVATHTPFVSPRQRLLLTLLFLISLPQVQAQAGFIKLITTLGEP